MRMTKRRLLLRKHDDEEAYLFSNTRFSVHFWVITKIFDQQTKVWDN